MLAVGSLAVMVWLVQPMAGALVWPVLEQGRRLHPGTLKISW